MFNNDLFSDVKFVVQKMDGESESKQVIPAHKFVLSISSPVFEAMFYGELAETRNSIELPDCEYESLLELFRYMYSDEVNLSGSNVMGVLYLAKKYMVPSLADKCTDYLQENLAPTNVFSILPSAQKYDEKDLVDRCWNVIDRETEEAVKSDGFATIDRSLLEAVIERDALSISEVELFKRVVQWATKESERQGLVADGQVVRRILGERIVKVIRFPVMTQQEFATDVLDTKILTLDEVTDIIKYFNSAPNSPVGFPVSKRAGGGYPRALRICRFGSFNFGWGNSKSQLIFSVNKDILFHGVYLFGSEGHDYSVILTIREFPNMALRACTKSDKCSSILHQSMKYWGFDVLLYYPVALKKSVRYHIDAAITGPMSFYGNGGKSPVECSGFTFKFENVDGLGGTGVTHGQINELVFSPQ